jgi:hypothetical protein
MAGSPLFYCPVLGIDRCGCGVAARVGKPAMKKSGITITYYDVVPLLCHEVLQVFYGIPPEEEMRKGLPPALGTKTAERSDNELHGLGNYFGRIPSWQTPQKSKRNGPHLGT